MSEPIPPRHEALRRWRAEVQAALPQLSPDVREELALHVTERWLDARAGGATPEDADAVARRELRNWPARPVPAQTGGWRPSRMFSGLRVDGRAAIRSLGARPAVTLAAATLTALAIGANAVIITLSYGILGRPLPYPHGDRLGVVWQTFRGDQQQVAYPDYLDFRTAPVFDASAAISGGRGSARVGDGIERVNVIAIEPAGLEMLGAKPWLGRVLRADDATAPVVLVSHRFWRRHLSSDPGIVGRPIWLSGATYTIVGVLQEGFDFELPVGPFEMESHDVWMPFDPTGFAVTRRDVTTYEVLVRLAPEASPSMAQAALDAIGARLASTYADTNAGRAFQFVGLRDHITERARRPLQLLLVAGIATFAIAMANLATLTLVRLRARQRDTAVMDALGASALRLRSQLVLESLLMAAAGSLAGVLVASIAVPALVSSEAANLPRPDAIRLDVVSYLVAAALGTLMTLGLSVLPVRPRDSVVHLRASARSTGAGAAVTRRVLVPMELAVAVALSTGGALLALSLVRQLSLDPGFAVDGVSTLRVSAYAERYPDKARTVAFFMDLTARAARLPAAEAAGASSSLPLSGQGTGTAVVAYGGPTTLDAMVQAGWQFVTPGYFAATGVQLVSGRDFTPDEIGRDVHASIISESLAARLFPGGDAVGRRIATGGGTTDWHEVIGVARDVRHTALTASPQPRVYDLLGQHWGRTMFLVGRTRAGSPDLLASLRGAARELDPQAPVFEASTMPALVARSTGAAALAGRVAVGLSIASILIAIVGVYGVVSANAAGRTREFGVRVALGARPVDLHRRVLREHAAMLAGGAVLGLAGCALVVRLLDAALFGVDGRQAAVIALGLTLGLAAISIATALAATRRAARVDPLVALRSE